MSYRVLTEQEAIDENIYKRQLTRKWGYQAGDPCLESLSESGERKIGYFGKAAESHKKEADVDAEEEQI